MSPLPEARAKRGRPRKFLEPTRALTLTLPVSVIEALASIDPDPSKAVVRLSRTQRAAHRQPAAAELAAFGRRAVIVINPSRQLEQRTGVFLVPLADGRALIAFDERLTPSRLELSLEDALRENGLPQPDSDIFRSIRDVLRHTRRSDAARIRQCGIIVIEFPKRVKRAGPSQGEATRVAASARPPIRRRSQVES